MSRPKNRKRRQNADKDVRKASQQTPYISQPIWDMPPYNIATEEQVAMIHEKSMQILEEGGIAFIYEPALEILRANGVKTKGDVAYFDREMVMEYLAKVPSEFTWSSRNPEKEVKIGGKNICWAPVVGPPFVIDRDHGRRISQHEDLINFLKLTQSSPYLHCSGAEIVVSTDIPIAHRHLECFYEHFVYTDKPVMGIYHTGPIGIDSLEMAKIVYGEEAMREKPYLHCIVNVSSPRRLDDRMLGLLIAYAEMNQIVNVTPFILSGAMGPTSILGTVAQLNAEALSGIVFTQMVNEGNPCVYGSFQAVTDLQSGAPVFGAPESQLALYLSSQMARHYGIPFRAAGGYASSKLADAQGMAESVMAMMPSMYAQPNFVLHAAGWLEAGLTAGYEKFMLDEELLGMYHRYMKGVSWDEDEWAMDSIIHDVEPGGHHLGTAHTMRHYKDAFYRSKLFDYDSGEAWLANGATDAYERANLAYKQRLKDYEQPSLDAGIKDGLRDYIERRKIELAK